MRNEIKEYEAVAKAAEKFVKSVAEGNSEYAKTLFTDDAVLFGILNGNVERGSIEQFYHNVDTVGAGTIDFTDFLLLLKLDGEWKCVAKAYNQNSNTISK